MSVHYGEAVESGPVLLGPEGAHICVPDASAAACLGTRQDVHLKGGLLRVVIGVAQQLLQRQRVGTEAAGLG
jgi:hypothetical protein